MIPLVCFTVFVSKIAAYIHCHSLWHILWLFPYNLTESLLVVVVVNFTWGFQKVSWDEESTLPIPTWCNRKDFIQMHKQVVLQMSAVIWRKEANGHLTSVLSAFLLSHKENGAFIHLGCHIPTTSYWQVAPPTLTGWIQFPQCPSLFPQT